MSLVRRGRAQVRDSLARAAVLGLLCSSPPYALAQDAAEGGAQQSTDDFARQVFQAGKAAYAIGNYTEALRYFQQAYELSDRPALLYNIGQAADRLRQDETALKALELYLSRVPDAQNKLEVQERIKVLQAVVQAKRFNPYQAAAAAPQPPQSANAAARLAAPATSSPETARQAAPLRSDTDTSSLLSQWWFWAGTGAVVVAVVVTAVVLGSGETVSTRDPYTGSNGKVIATLRVATP